MNIKTVVTGDLEENCYILENNGDCIIIDPGDDFDKIKNNINGSVKAVLLTHRHPDHIGALEECIKIFKPQILDKTVVDEDTYKIDSFSFNVIFTPGHTEDSITYYFFKENVMFTGDFLFCENIGRCDLGGDFEEMKKSINKIKKYKDDVIIYPGHGEKSSIGHEKEFNYYFK